MCEHCTDGCDRFDQINELPNHNKIGLLLIIDIVLALLVQVIMHAQLHQVVEVRLHQIHMQIHVDIVKKDILVDTIPRSSPSAFVDALIQRVVRGACTRICFFGG